MSKNIKNVLILFILFTCFIFISIHSYANTISNNLSNNFFRLHILANSNSEYDQNLKLKVRDNIIEYMNTLTYSGITKAEAIEITKNNLDKFQNIAENTIKDAGYDYPVSVEIGNFYFPTKEYGNISLPAGNYDALRINIGSAEGQNWWCSLFPPLCFVDISSGIIDEEAESNLKENLSSEEFAIITGNSETVKFKLKIIEVLAK